MEKIGHFIDRENERIFRTIQGQRIQPTMKYLYAFSEEMNIPSILYESTKKWDGGYAMMGIIGHGDAFVMRDPHGIRPAYYYIDDEIIVAASERPVIQSVFNAAFDAVKEIQPGSCTCHQSQRQCFRRKYFTTRRKNFLLF
ncbi:MAG: hypothetical protein KatS3mg028_0176 [Bacteroidia bacterium]|nr:MAG: hypothetical protein KatS3mg028_0176 [Bacteroidia bacterium]